MHQEYKNTITQNKLKQLKSPGLVASYDLYIQKTYTRHTEQSIPYVTFATMSVYVMYTYTIFSS